MNTLTAPVARQISPENKFITLPRIPSACTSVMNRVSDLYWEKRFNIHTSGRREARQADAIHYEPLPYYAVFKVMDRLNLTADDVLVDVGSGLGRAVCVAASYPVRQVLGVELEPDLNALGMANVARANLRRAPVRLRCQSAELFDYRAATVLWVFNPFGPATMRAVLARVRDSLEKHPRALRIAYINATCGHVFAAQPWLELEETWEMSAWSRVKTPVRFYRTQV
ncbi:MAG TPA: class I SAM-dependent methyltransferase [Opitutaceae bacterium]|nr:class I SAM-dependent methyltransferase [Opitutaceae bacterium]